MEFEQMLPTLQSQASRIFNGDKDSIQDALSMAYLNYNNCLNRKNREFSIGELTNFIKHRSTELNNGTRPHFGNTSNKRTNDVYYRLASHKYSSPFSDKLPKPSLSSNPLSVQIQLNRCIQEEIKIRKIQLDCPLSRKWATENIYYWLL